MCSQPPACLFEFESATTDYYDNLLKEAKSLDYKHTIKAFSSTDTLSLPTFDISCDQIKLEQKIDKKSSLLSQGLESISKRNGKDLHAKNLRKTDLSGDKKNARTLMKLARKIHGIHPSLMDAEMAHFERMRELMKASIELKRRTVENLNVEKEKEWRSRMEEVMHLEMDAMEAATAALKYIQGRLANKETVTKRKKKKKKKKNEGMERQAQESDVKVEDTRERRKEEAVSLWFRAIERMSLEEKVECTSCGDVELD